MTEDKLVNESPDWAELANRLVVIRKLVERLMFHTQKHYTKGPRNASMIRITETYSEMACDVLKQ